MLMQRMANYFNGVVRIKISGAVPERLINLCLARDILLWGISKQDNDLIASIRLPDFYRLRALTKKSQTRVRVVGFGGFPFAAKRVRRRKMLVVGAVLFFCLLQFLASYIWFVDVTGNKQVSMERVKAVAVAHGLKPGVSRDKIDYKTVEQAILLQVPEVAWVGVNFTGTRAIIEVVEKTLPKAEDKSPAHIVAGKDGVITEVIVITGQAAVKKGDTVKRGDLLIKGFAVQAATPQTPGQPTVISVPSQLIRAQGIVKAKIWYESYGEASLIQEKLERTGRQVIAVTLRAGGRDLVLKHAPDQPFSRFDTEVVHKKLSGWRNSQFAVESTINIFHELSGTQQEITPEAARDLAMTKALAAVQGRIPETAQVLARNIETLKTADPGLVRIKVSVETIEEITQTINISQQ